MKTSGNGTSRRRTLAAGLLAAAMLSGSTLTGCSVKPHELLGVESLFGSETSENVETETTEEAPGRVRRITCISRRKNKDGHLTFGVRF